jgi:tRNA (adenine57-N1/adenine58-N1)-methyltransferase
MSPSTQTAQPGDVIQLVGLRHKHFIFTLTPGAEFQSHRGVLKHDDLVGKAWGSQVFSHLGAAFFMLRPSLADILTDLPRTTQILYPKDIGFILLTIGVGPGQRILEAGTGSGAMTIALANAVGPTGSIVSYEQRIEMHRLARKNVERAGLSGRVDFKMGDIGAGFDETGMDAVFLDVPNPFDYLAHVRAALVPGGHFATILPTYNQVEKTLHALRHNQFAFVEICEVLLRYYKTEPSRLRPTDRMVAHTGFLIFARRIEPSEDPRAAELLAEQSLTDSASAVNRVVAEDLGAG